MTRPTSPASSGPAGAHFEGQVAASYLLSMLVAAEPRGLPGTTFDRVQLQRNAEGFPLDDVIIHAHTPQGAAAILEIQVKRDVTFAPGDPVFKSVVSQIAEASEKDGFWEHHHEFSIATAHASSKIAGPYQDVLTWARELPSGVAFMARINRAYSANSDMRTFVQTFGNHLKDAGVPHDDNSIWRLLRRVQIHVYDFTAPGSAAQDYALDRAARALHPEDTPKAGALWSSLVGHSIRIAATGGERSRDSLVTDLVREGFRLAGDRRTAETRRVLAEFSELALADINDRILGFSLGRKDRVDSIRKATEAGRYIEIRGDAGVGKSGLLKHFARVVGMEARCIVVSPARITPRGWTAMKGDIQFDGSARDLLQDLSADGGGFVFIDNLDFFSVDEQTTVKDLVRAAAEVPGVAVIATARTRFGADNSNWLPREALDRLGRAHPIFVSELNLEEVSELRAGDHRLHALLAEGHPAKDVTHNLFRLGRLAELSPDQPSPRSEVDMADLWWRTADGEADEGLRERARLLRDLAARSMTGEQTFDVHDKPAAAVDALVASETLRDMGNDRVAFRHDVLREWAVACHLFLDETALGNCDLNRHAPPEFERGLELAARFSLEKLKDVSRWLAILGAVSSDGAHKTWRRAVLLAIAHSEVASELLPLVGKTLMANEGSLLRELLPLVMAVDVQPAKELWIAHGMDPSAAPENLHVPKGPVWLHLTIWLLRVENETPPQCLPEIIDFFGTWCLVGGMMSDDPLTRAILTRFKEWLIKLESAYESHSWKERHAIFGGTLSSDQLDRLEEDIRPTFLALALRVPDLAAEYLQSVRGRKNKERIYSKLLKFRGTLAQAAPAELAAMTLDALVRPPQEKRKRGNYYENDALTYLDRELIPASPAQGPFYDLLVHAPTHGLELIRSLIDTVISFHADGEAPALNDAFVIELPEGPRRFPWTRTYGWSRSSHFHSVTSALMALETWAHSRIERGDNVDMVLTELLGDADAPAAYLLVVIDVLLSHWPATRGAAVAYVSNPDLLATDRSRPIQEGFKYPDFFGLDALQREPPGPKLETLKGRPSRRVSLDALLSRYALGEWSDLRLQARTLLTKAAQRLGPIQPDDDLGYPRLMAVHALNLLDSTNYREVVAERRDGSKVGAYEYVAPEQEARHFEAMQEAARERLDDASAVQLVGELVDNPEKSSPAHAEVLAAWARKPRDTRPPENSEKVSFLDRAFAGAALIAMRDGTPQLRDDNREWAESVFDHVLSEEPDAGLAMMDEMRFNPVATVFAGRVFATGSSPASETIRNLLQMAAGNPGAAHGAVAAAEGISAWGEGFPRALLRIAFAACVHPWHPWDAPGEEKAATEEAQKARVQSAIESELQWLATGGTEPSWPEFPDNDGSSGRRRGIRIGRHQTEDGESRKQRPDTWIDLQSAALWLRSAWRSGTVEHCPWIFAIWSTYSPWTFKANGANQPEDEEASAPPREWNSIFFRLAANCLPGLNQEEVEVAIAPFMVLPDKAFCLVAATFLRSLDGVFFNETCLAENVAVDIRARFAERLNRCSGWRRLRGTRSSGVEMDLGPAGAVLFFNDQNYFQPSTCYLSQNAAVRSTAFIPVLQQLAATAPSPFVAVVLLNWMEVSPRLEHLSMLLRFCMEALEAYQDSRAFWIDHGVGRRVCNWLQSILKDHHKTLTDDTKASSDLAHILASLVAVGVPEARSVEKLLHLRR